MRELFWIWHTSTLINLPQPSLMEMQAIITDLVENFQFSIPKEKPDIMRVPAGIMGPMVKGKMFEGMQMPLHVVAL